MRDGELALLGRQPAEDPAEGFLGRQRAPRGTGNAAGTAIGAG